jgi:TPR repeat protein
MNASPIARAAALAVLWLTACVAYAIEVPKPQAAPEEKKEAPPPELTVTPTDEREFYEKVQRVTSYRALRGLKIPADVIANLGRGDAEKAVATLSGLASQGSNDANIALVHVQHWCVAVTQQRAGDPKAQIAKLVQGQPDARAARVAGVIYAEVEFMQRARAACVRANSIFDYKGIEARLRAAAAAGDPASATELAQFLLDPAKREAMLQTAVKKNYPPAVYKVATNLLIAVQRGQTTENVSQIRELLKIAGREIPRAKLDLANCMAVGCDGHPADALTARAFGIDAARDGEPTAFPSMVRMPWGARIPRPTLLAWQLFGDKLNESGCMGDQFVPTALALTQTISMLTRVLDDEELQETKKQFDALWAEHGARAMKENGCG